jgi:hypothetical protein
MGEWIGGLVHARARTRADADLPAAGPSRVVGSARPPPLNLLLNPPRPSFLFILPARSSPVLLQLSNTVVDREAQPSPARMPSAPGAPALSLGTAPAKVHLVQRAASQEFDTTPVELVPGERSALGRQDSLESTRSFVSRSHCLSQPDGPCFGRGS